MRLELTKKTDLAFQALGYMAKSKKERVTGAVLADALDITPQYLPHVMAPLTRAGWVDSVSGPRGGYSIDTDLVNVSLLNLIEAVEGAFDDSRCLHLGPMHTGEIRCALHEPWIRARTALLRELDGSTLAEMITSQS